MRDLLKESHSGDVLMTSLIYTTFLLSKPIHYCLVPCPYIDMGKGDMENYNQNFFEPTAGI